MRTSRRLSLNGTPKIAAAPRMAAAASRNRAVSTSNGGQSATASLATENAEAQSRQNAATSTGRGNRNDGFAPADDDKAMFAARMGHVLSAPHIGLRVVIWKLNDKIISSGFVNESCHARHRPSPQLRLGRSHR